MPYIAENITILVSNKSSKPIQVISGLILLLKLYIEDIKYERDNDLFNLKLDIF